MGEPPGTFRHRQCKLHRDQGGGIPSGSRAMFRLSTHPSILSWPLVPTMGERNQTKNVTEAKNTGRNALSLAKSPGGTEHTSPPCLPRVSENTLNPSMNTAPLMPGVPWGRPLPLRQKSLLPESQMPLANPPSQDAVTGNASLYPTAQLNTSHRLHNASRGACRGPETCRLGA